jgi:Cu(I)/Ag(I) efflux system periplasmic protein CusF
MKHIAFAVVFAMTTALPVLADENHHKDKDKDAGASAGATQASAMSEGEVRRVDKDAKKITIKHGPLENLDMPAMTMVFQVKDPAMLEQVKPGDKVRFQAEKVGSAFTVTKIEAAP